MNDHAWLKRAFWLGAAGAVLVIAASLVRFPPVQGASLSHVVRALVVAAVVAGRALAWATARAGSMGK